MEDQGESIPTMILSLGENTRTIVEGGFFIFCIFFTPSLVFIISITLNKLIFKLTREKIGASFYYQVPPWMQVRPRDFGGGAGVTKGFA
jgi:hypothetical protein